MRFAHCDSEGVELIEEQLADSGGIGGKGLLGELDQGFIAAPVSFGRRCQQPVALGDAAQILIGYGYWVLERI